MVLRTSKAYYFIRLIIIGGIICFIFHGIQLVELNLDSNKLVKKLFHSVYFQEWHEFDNVHISYNKDIGITTLTFDDTNTKFFMRIDKGELDLNESEMISYKEPIVYMSVILKNGEQVRGKLTDSNQIELLDAPYWIYDFISGIKNTPDGSYQELNQEDYEMFALFDMERRRFLEIVEVIKRDVMYEDIIMYAVMSICYFGFLAIVTIVRKRNVTFPLIK